MDNKRFQVKYKSSPNIAWVKYWGKYDEDYILPINDSLGLTLNTDDIHTQTRIVFSPEIPEDALYLNKQKHPLSSRVKKMFVKIRKTVYDRKFKDVFTSEVWDTYHFHIESTNSFPTASGMASSASGLSCLAAALNGLFGDVLSEQQLSELARLGSGSASRSICGGLVRWTGVPEEVFSGKKEKSEQLLEELSKTCISKTVVEAAKLSKIKVLILLANNKKKEVSSTSGMQQSVQTSELIKLRNSIANSRTQHILASLDKFNSSSQEEEQRCAFNQVVETIIKDSNQFHAICLDTYPPIFYLQDFSKQIINIVDQIFNKTLPFKVAYTFDAGPHAFLFMHESVLQQVLKYFVRLFGGEVALNKKAKESLNLEVECSFGEYGGEVVAPWEMWVSDVGQGSSRVEQ